MIASKLHIGKRVMKCGPDRRFRITGTVRSKSFVTNGFQYCLVLWDGTAEAAKVRVSLLEPILEAYEAVSGSARNAGQNSASKRVREAQATDSGGDSLG